MPGQAQRQALIEIAGDARGLGRRGHVRMQLLIGQRPAIEQATDLAQELTGAFLIRRRWRCGLARHQHVTMILIDDLRGDGSPHRVVLLHARGRDADLTRTDGKQAIDTHVRLEASAEIDVAAEHVLNDVAILLGRQPARDRRAGGDLVIVGTCGQKRRARRPPQATTAPTAIERGFPIIVPLIDASPAASSTRPASRTRARPRCNKSPRSIRSGR